MMPATHSTASSNTVAGLLSGQLFNESSPDLKGRLVAIYTALGALNIGAWIWALAAFHGRPVPLALSLMIYGLGLRHAVDADHIAAIDNVTRKFMQENRRPVSVGFFFAMGHSAIVIFVAAIVARAANTLGRFESFRRIGGTISVSASTLFLFALAAMNMAIFFSVYKSYRRVRSGGSYVQEDLDVLCNSGILARCLKPLFGLVTRSWHMFALGFLFGLGFDTATEVAMFGMSVEQAAKGISFWAVLVFPALFAAGMSLIDTTDGVMMLGAYEWAFVKPMRKLYYNMTITLLSVVIALLIGGIEALGLAAGRLRLDGPVWRAVVMLSENFNNLGFVIIGVFLFGWLLSYVLYRTMQLDKLDARSG